MTFENASQETNLILMAALASHIVENLQGCAACLSVLCAAILTIPTQHLHSEDIHPLTSAFKKNSRLSVLFGYYHSIVILEQVGETNISQHLTSGLIQATSAGKASIHMLFGCQGANKVYLEEPVHTSFPS
jgi:hypothetical protein